MKVNFYKARYQNVIKMGFMMKMMMIYKSWVLNFDFGFSPLFIGTKNDV